MPYVFNCLMSKHACSVHNCQLIVSVSYWHRSGGGGWGGVGAVGGGGLGLGGGGHTCCIVAHLNGNRAAIGTTHGEIVVPKLFETNGPSGTYSHFWMSLAETKDWNHSQTRMQQCRNIHWLISSRSKEQHRSVGQHSCWPRGTMPYRQPLTRFVGKSLTLDSPITDLSSMSRVESLFVKFWVNTRSNDHRKFVVNNSDCGSFDRPKFWHRTSLFYNESHTRCCPLMTIDNVEILACNRRRVIVG